MTEPNKKKTFKSVIVSEKSQRIRVAHIISIRTIIILPTAKETRNTADII